MARFRGIVRGARGEASRLGHPNGGLTTEANGWGGGVHVALFDKSGDDWARVTLTRGSNGNGPELLIYEGPVDSVREDRMHFIVLPPASRPKVAITA